MTERLLAVLGQSLMKFPVVLYAFVFLSNHAHLLIRAANAFVASGFLGHLKRNCALAIKAHTGWADHVWGPGSTMIPVLDDSAVVRRLAYILSNSVKEGLVDHPLEWPGPTCARALIGDGTIQVPEFRLAPKRAVATEPPGAPETRTIQLAPIPCWEHLPDGRRVELAAELMDGAASDAVRARGGRPALGRARVMAQNPFEPIPIEHSRPPIAHYTSPEAFAAYLAERDEHWESYNIAARALRRNGSPVIFPEGSFTPSCGFVDE